MKPMRYRPQWDLSTIPNEAFEREQHRRNYGRPLVLKCCPWCDELMSYPVLKRHMPECPKKRERKKRATATA